MATASTSVFSEGMATWPAYGLLIATPRIIIANIVTLTRLQFIPQGVHLQ
jgi:hypothetical protein